MQDKSDSDIADISWYYAGRPRRGVGRGSGDRSRAGTGKGRHSAPADRGLRRGLGFYEAMAHPGAMRKTTHPVAWPVIAELASCRP